MFAPETRILIADDFLSMRRVIKDACNEIGLTNTAEAADGAQAWELIQNADPPIGLVISDLRMPKMDGLELLQKVRKDPRFKAIPFIIVTAEGEKDYITEAVVQGVNSYVLKPFDKDEFISKLERVYAALGKNTG